MIVLAVLTIGALMLSTVFASSLGHDDARAKGPWTSASVDSIPDGQGDANGDQGELANFVERLSNDGCEW